MHAFWLVLTYDVLGDRRIDDVLIKTSSFDMDNSDGKASLKRQKSPETTTDTQGMSKFHWFYV